MFSKYPPFFWIFTSTALFLCLWFLVNLGAYRDLCWSLGGIGIASGIAGYFLFSLSLLLSSRWKKIEDWMGGLDRIYHLHRTVGIWGFCLILLHPYILTTHWWPEHLDKVFLFALPIHGRLSMNLGSVAFWMMILILGITFLKLLPYDKWKIVHKFMSVVFILATLHILLSERRVGSSLSQWLLYIPMGIGLFGILYKQIFVSFFMRQLSCRVVSTQYINENVIEVRITSQGTFNFTPGQYGFFSFEGPFLSGESHPFTLIGSSDETTASLLIKARGDFTKALFQHVKVGDVVKFEGPYGRFDRTKAAGPQIWIAGGIGVAPFLAWIRTMENSSLHMDQVDFYYCVHEKCDAIFLDEFERMSETNPYFHYFIYCSEDKNRLDVQKVVNTSGSLNGKKILICGPQKLTRDFTKQFQLLGVKREDIFFEDFEFF